MGETLQVQTQVRLLAKSRDNKYPGQGVHLHGRQLNYCDMARTCTNCVQVFCCTNSYIAAPAHLKKGLENIAYLLVSAGSQAQAPQLRGSVSEAAETAISQKQTCIMPKCTTAQTLPKLLAASQTGYCLTHSSQKAVQQLMHEVH